MSFYQDTMQGLLEAVEMEHGDFMNPPETIPVTEGNIVEEYKRTNDIKRVAKVFCLSVKEAKDALKRAGIKV